MVVRAIRCREKEEKNDTRYFIKRSSNNRCKVKIEFQLGHVKGSINIPLATITRQINKISCIKKPVVLCCASGIRSGSATSILKSAGIECYNGGSWINLN